MENKEEQGLKAGDMVRATSAFIGTMRDGTPVRGVVVEVGGRYITIQDAYGDVRNLHPSWLMSSETADITKGATSPDRKVSPARGCPGNGLDTPVGNRNQPWTHRCVSVRNIGACVSCKHHKDCLDVVFPARECYFVHRDMPMGRTPKGVFSVGDRVSTNLAYLAKQSLRYQEGVVTNVETRPDSNDLVAIRMDNGISTSFDSGWLAFVKARPGSTCGPCARCRNRCGQ